MSRTDTPVESVMVASIEKQHQRRSRENIHSPLTAEQALNAMLPDGD